MKRSGAQAAASQSQRAAKRMSSRSRAACLSGRAAAIACHRNGGAQGAQAWRCGLVLPPSRNRPLCLSNSKAAALSLNGAWRSRSIVARHVAEH